MMTLGMFNLKGSEEPQQFGRGSRLGQFTIQSVPLKRERRVSSIALHPYTDKAGFDPRNVWLYAFYDLRYDVASTLAKNEGAGKVYKIDGKEAITAIPTDTIWQQNETRQALGAKLVAFSKDIEEFQQLLEKSSNSVEEVFLQYLNSHPHLLELYATKIEPQPFLKIPDAKLSTVGGTGRFPDYIAFYSDGTYLLIELEKASKPILVGKDNQPSNEVTQAVNQTSTWNEIIRNFGNYISQYPGLANHRNLIVIGRDETTRQTRQQFHEELNRINQDFGNARTTIVTYDELVGRARAVMSRILAIQTMIG
jgi:hypothetical protein